MAAEQPRKWAIEDSFPIVEINRLAVPERNAFKPIYQMHKWFARRASCVFRAILLGCLKPLPVDETGNLTKSGAQVIMEEFYKDHTRDPDTNGKVILDPFMGGGTTVVEALRLGCKVIGIDLNPVAWFIVKCETTPVDIAELERAFDDLANRTVPWSGKPLKQTLLELYKTTCPCCGNTDADIIYAFWVKSAICTDPTCRKQVPLFSDYFVAAKQPSIRYYQDATCPKCRKSFDWEIEPASLIAEQALTVVNNADGAGVGRGNKRWAFATTEPVGCPWCGDSVKPKLAPGRTKSVRKKVPLTVLLCPHCQAVWQCRGTVPDHVACPACKHEYEPHEGNAVESGGFVCPHCGKRDKVLSSIRSLPDDQPLPMSMYAIHGWCSSCGKGGDDDEADEEDAFDANLGAPMLSRNGVVGQASRANGHWCRLAKSGGKFFKRIDPADLELYTRAARTWEQRKHRLPYPQSEIPDGQETHRLLEHHYRRWHQLFLHRQLLAHSSLLASIDCEKSVDLQELLLCAFSNMLEANNVFVRNISKRSTPGGTPPAGIFARHDFQPKATFCEQHVWGTVSGNNTFISRIDAVRKAVHFARSPADTRLSNLDGRIKQVPVASGESVARRSEDLLRGADARVAVREASRYLHVVTDPPYGGNVNYSELADFFHVWVRLCLKDRYVEFAPEYTPKAAEIVENRARGQGPEEFRQGMYDVLFACAAMLPQDGLLVFTFHHTEGQTWEALLGALFDAGFVAEAIYPIHAEREQSLHLLDKAGIAYDLVHICRKRTAATRDARSWAGIRPEIRRRARQEIEVIERGRYGNEPLSPADVNIILIGKCLELYSRHYGHVLDHERRNVPLHEALETIRMEVDQLVSRQQPLPSELADIDAVSYVYLVCLADKAFEIKGDELHKYTRGVIEPDELLKAGLIIKGRTGRGRFFKIKSPAERFGEIQERLGEASSAAQAALPGMEEAVAADTGGKLPFIDYVHFLIALVDGGENLRPWMERFRGMTPQIRAACEYLRTRQPRFADACGKILKFIEVAPLFG
ncbi:MAG TPA: DNA methyltransferase [Phycisphaerae bacterium]|nr:DNA methyltransferase [Phycisphaerae bacterium]HNU44818.1 DNA methyltransferase [Phycisphaerae bacterium]